MKIKEVLLKLKGEKFYKINENSKKWYIKNLINNKVYEVEYDPSGYWSLFIGDHLIENFYEGTPLIKEVIKTLEEEGYIN